MNTGIVVILGASPKTDRYSNKAQRMLLSAGYGVVPIAPGHDTIDGVACFPSLKSYGGPVDTVTLYLSPKRLLPILEELLELRPRRVIFNPGTESDEACVALREIGIVCEEACTLVLLQTGQF
jgi:predicted CoA-binding protein